jgi:hypothetical protein
VRHGRVTVTKLGNLPGHPNCYRPPQETHHD